MGGCVRIAPVSNLPKMILASNSPRRRQLLELTGWDFEVRSTDLDEDLLPGESPGAYVVRLAGSKARVCAQNLNGGTIILAADTTVVDADAVLGKPADPVEAESMLRGLRGHTHQVYTGLAVCRTRGDDLITDLCITDVPMRSYSDEEMHTYIASGDPLDKAGAYAIQHPDFHPVETMTGCFASVMGLPLCHLVNNLKRLGLEAGVDVPARCQSALEYKCPVWQGILMGEPLG
jgi:septum formation protein